MDQDIISQEWQISFLISILTERQLDEFKSFLEH